MRQALNAGRLEAAEAAFDAGVLPAAAGLCQLVLVNDPANAEALRLLARVADALRAAGTDQAATPAQERFLVIKAWGHGFWSEVSHVIGGLLLAEITRRTPIVHWGGNSLFGDGGTRDAFVRYFQPVSARSLVDLGTLADADFFPSKWRADNLQQEELNKWQGPGSRTGAIQFLHRPERIAVADFFVSVPSLARWIPSWHPLAGKSAETIYRDLLQRHLRRNAAMTALCDDFLARRLAGRRFAAVHLRGSDKVQEAQDIGERNQQVIALAQRLPQDLAVLLLTDDLNYAAQMQALLGERLVLPDSERTGDGTGVHFAAGGDPFRRGAEVLRDTYLALGAERFIGNGYSNVAGMIALMRDWPSGSCTLVSPPYLLQFQPVLYLPLELARRFGVAQPDELVDLAR